MHRLLPLLAASLLLTACSIEFDDDNGLADARDAIDGCSEDRFLDEMDATVLVAFPVTDGGRGLACLGDETELGDEYWTLFESVAPVSTREKITYFVVFGDAADNTTEGFAQPLDDVGAEWLFALNGDSENPEELAFTAVHELAHVLTLNDDEIAFAAAECDTFATGEGCAHADSALNTFVDTYWLDLLDPLFDLEDEGEDPSFPLCDANPEQFFRAYNATNPGEDLAEMFAVFVFDLETQGGIVEDKKQFFADLDIAVEVRDYVRSNGVTAPAAGVLGDCE